MEFMLGTAIVAGLIGTVVMTAVMYAGGMMGMHMDMPMMLGTMVMPRGTAAWVIGAMLHLMMGTAFFVVYAAIFDAAAIDSGIVAWSAGFGVVHGVMAGLAMGMMPAIHPRLETATSGTGTGVSAPGMFGLRMGPMGPVAIIALHVIFGLVAGAVYAA